MVVENAQVGAVWWPGVLVWVNFAPSASRRPAEIWIHHL